MFNGFLLVKCGVSIASFLSSREPVRPDPPAGRAVGVVWRWQEARVRRGSVTWKTGVEAAAEEGVEAAAVG